MAVEKIISPKFVEGFVGECWRNGLMEKEAAALLDGYLDATMSDGMEKSAVMGHWQLLKELTKRMGKDITLPFRGNGAVRRAVWNTAKFPATWVSKGFKKHPALGTFGLIGAGAAYGGPIAALDYYKTNGEGGLAPYLRKYIGDKSWFGFGPGRPTWNENELINLGGGSSVGDYSVHSLREDNPYTGPLAAQGAVASSSGGSVGGGTRSGGGMWTLGQSKLDEFNAAKSTLASQRKQLAEIDKRMASGSEVDRMYWALKKKKVTDGISGSEKKLTEMVGANNKNLADFQQVQRQKTIDAAEYAKRQSRNAREVMAENGKKTVFWNPLTWGKRDPDKAFQDNKEAEKALEHARRDAEKAEKFTPVTVG